MSAFAGRRVRMLVFRQYDRVARAWRESEALAQAGARVEIFLLGREGQPVEALLASGVRVVRATAARPDSRKPWQALRGYTAFARAIGSEPADVYHCLDGATLPLGVVLARRDGARLVYDATDYFTDHLPAPPSETRIDRIRRRYTPNYLWEMLLIRWPDARLAVSPDIANLLAARYRLPKEPAVVPNSANYWRPTEPSRTLLRDAINADPGERVVVFIGSVHDRAAYALESDRQRGLDLLVDALGSLAGTRLAIIGSAPDEYRAAVLERARRRGAEGRISFLGLRDHPEYIELASGGDVGVYLAGGRPQSTSFANTLPNRLFDFVMARLPIVVGSGTPTARIVRDYDIGAVLERVDPPGVATAIGVLSSGERHDRCVENTERAASELCWERKSSRLIEVYSGLASSSSAT